MTDAAAPRPYLIAPTHPRLAQFPEILARLLDDHDIACVRMGHAGETEDELSRMADTLRPICHERDVPLVITGHFRMVTPLGLDGVHLPDGAKQVRAARKELPSDSIVGAYSQASRHDGMNAGEIGADYVSFGPVSPSSLGDGTLAPMDLFSWWSEMIEVPVVAEGGISVQQAQDLASICDFIALGEELWSHPEGPDMAMKEYAPYLG